MGSVLLVGSDPDSRARWGAAIREAGHEVLTASTTREAVLRTSEGGIDAIVIDSYDPRVGVVELARSLDTLPDTPPVVLISGSPHAPEISARIGAAEFLPKPVETSEIVTLLARLLCEPRPTRNFEDEDPTGPIKQTG